MREYIEIFTDGGSRSNPGIAGLGVHIQDATGATLQQLSQFLGIKTNNEAEYLAFLKALEFLREFAAVAKKQQRELEFHFFADSKLLVEQLNRHWKIKEPRLQQLAQQAWQGLAALPYPYTLQHVLRAKNKQADQLANQAMDAGSLQTQPLA